MQGSNSEEWFVRCPDGYKDALIADLIDFYSPKQKVIIVCETKKQASKLFYSTQIERKKVLLHSGLFREERSNTVQTFASSPIFQCLFTTSLHYQNRQFPTVFLSIFASPPKNCQLLEQNLIRTPKAKFIVIAYSSGQQKEMLRIKSMKEHNFRELDPPDVHSDEQTQITSSPPQTYQLHVSNLPPYAKKLSVIKFFTSMRVIHKNVILPKVSETSRNRFAIVDFYDEVNLNLALKLNGCFMQKHQLSIKQSFYMQASRKKQQQ